MGLSSGFTNFPGPARLEWEVMVGDVDPGQRHSLARARPRSSDHGLLGVVDSEGCRMMGHGASSSMNSVPKPPPPSGPFKSQLYAN